MTNKVFVYKDIQVDRQNFVLELKLGMILFNFILFVRFEVTSKW